MGRLPLRTVPVEKEQDVSAVELVDQCVDIRPQRRSGRTHLVLRRCVFLWAVLRGVERTDPGRSAPLGEGGEVLREAGAVVVADHQDAVVLECCFRNDGRWRGCADACPLPRRRTGEPSEDAVPSGLVRRVAREKGRGPAVHRRIPADCRPAGHAAGAVVDQQVLARVGERSVGHPVEPVQPTRRSERLDPQFQRRAGPALRGIGRHHHRACRKWLRQSEEDHLALVGLRAQDANRDRVSPVAAQGWAGDRAARGEQRCQSSGQEDCCKAGRVEARRKLREPHRPRPYFFSSPSGVPFAFRSL